MRWWRSLGGAIALLLAVVSPGAAQDAAERLYGRPIGAIRFEIEGRPVPSPATTLDALVVVRPGDPLRSEAVRESIVHLITGGRLDDVQVVASETQTGVDLLFKLTPRHPIDRLQLKGNLGLTESELQRLVRDRFGGLPSREQPERVARALTGILDDEGFPSASVTSSLEQTHDPDRATLVLTIDAGTRARIARTDVAGNSPLTPTAIIARTGTAPGQPYRRRAIDTALAGVADDLRKQGYYGAVALTQGDLDPAAPGGLNLALKVDAGPHVTLRWAGDPKPPGDEEDFVPMRRQKSADEDLLEDSDQRIASYWRLLGYRDVKVTHTREPQGDALIITFHTDRGIRYRIEKLDITGNAHVADATIRETLGINPGEWFDESRVLRGMAFVRLVYLRLGFYQAKVTELDPEDVPGSGTTTDVRQIVRIDISEGPETHIGVVTINGVAPEREAEVPGKVVSRTKPGALYVIENMLRDKAELDAFYRDRGFANEITGFVPSAGSEPGTMDVTISVVEGSQVKVGDIRVVGYQGVSPKSILDEMILREGEPYGESARLESQRRLTNMGVFRTVSIDLEPGLGDNLAHVIVTVEELPATSATFGGGLEVARRFKTPVGGGPTVDHLDLAPRGFFEIGRRNLGGKNRSIDFFSRISLRPGDTVGQGYGFSEYRVAGTYFEPRAFHSDTNLTMGISSEQAVRSTFNFVRQSLNADALRRLTPRVSVSGRYALEFTRLFNVKIKPSEQPFIDRIFPQVRLSILSNGAIWDRRNDPVDPIRGTVLTADWEVAARRIGSEVGYAKVFAQASGFHLVSASRRVVLAGRAEVGVARGFEREVIGSDGQPTIVADLPASQRFFAGGSTTVRGFQLDRLGASDVLDENGLSKGGNAIVVLNAEVRTTLGKLLKRDFGIVGFTDAGNVFARARQLDFTQLRGAYGVGLRYNSPLGPVRLDFGFKVHPQLISGRREHGWEYHLNIGEAF